MDSIEVKPEFEPITPVLKWKRVFNSTGPQPKPRHGHRAVAIKELLIIFGGGNEGIIEELNVYNTTSNEWSTPQISGYKPPGCAALGLVVDNTRILTFGGMIGYRKYSNDLYELETSQWHWSKLDPKPPLYHIAPRPRIGHSFTLIGSKVYLFGGLSMMSKNKKKSLPCYLNDLYTLDISSPNALAWDIPETVGVMPSPRESHTAVPYTDSRGKCKLFIYGGMSGSRLGDLWILDIDTMSWNNPICLGPQPLSRSLHTAVTVKNRMFVFGGWVPFVEQGTTSIVENEWICTSQIACLNLETMIWEKLNLDMSKGNMPRARAGHCAASIQSRMYIWSGRDGFKNKWNNQTYCKDLWYLEVDKPQKCSKSILKRASDSGLVIAWDSVPSADAYILQIQKTAETATLAPTTIIDYSLMPFLTPELANKYTYSSDDYQLEVSDIKADNITIPNQLLEIPIDELNQLPELPVDIVNQFLQLPTHTVNHSIQLPQDSSVNSLINYEQFTSVTSQASGNTKIKTVPSNYVSPLLPHDFQQVFPDTPYTVFDNSHFMDMESNFGMRTLSTTSVTTQNINTTVFETKQNKIPKPVFKIPSTSFQKTQKKKLINKKFHVNTTVPLRQAICTPCPALQTSVAGSNVLENQPGFPKPNLQSNCVTLVKTSQGNLIQGIPGKILGTTTPNKNMQPIIKIINPLVNQQNSSIKNYKTMTNVDARRPVIAFNKPTIVIRKKNPNQSMYPKVIIASTLSNISGTQTSSVSQTNVAKRYNLVNSHIQVRVVSSDRNIPTGSNSVTIPMVGASSPKIVTHGKSNLTCSKVSGEPVTFQMIGGQNKKALLTSNPGDHVVQSKNTNILNTFTAASSTIFNTEVPSSVQLSSNSKSKNTNILNTFTAASSTIFNTEVPSSVQLSSNLPANIELTLNQLNAVVDDIDTFNED